MNAIQYCKEPPTCKEARSFFDDYVPKIVRILLEKLEYGDIEAEVKPRIKTLLEGALEIVSSDLKEAAESKCCCKTWPILIDIFDEVTGYQESAGDLLVNGLSREGLCDFIRYLSNYIGTAAFPKFDEISTILNMLEVLVEKRYVRCGSKIVEPFILHLLSLEEKQLINLGDDSIDICRRLQNIIRVVRYPGQREFFELLRDFVFELISSSAAPLKLLGYKEIQQIAEASSGAFPPPRAYLVQDAGNGNFNGIYEFDSNYLSDGFVHGDAPIGYVRNVPNVKDPISSNGGAEETSKLDEKPIKIVYLAKKKRLSAPIILAGMTGWLLIQVGSAVVQAQRRH